jgi:hypothetical protein
LRNFEAANLTRVGPLNSKACLSALPIIPLTIFISKRKKEKKKKIGEKREKRRFFSRVEITFFKMLIYDWKLSAIA